MNFFTLIKRGLTFYWRTQLGVALGAAVAGAALTGSLLIGDSVRQSLLDNSLARIGQVQYALFAEGKFFREAIARELQDNVATRQPIPLQTAPVLALRGSIWNQEADARLPRVNVYGVDQRFWRLGNRAQDPFRSGAFIINQAAAELVKISGGDRVLLRFEKPDALPGDAAFAKASDWSYAQSIRLDAVAGPEAFGNFSMQANQTAPLNVFVPLDWLQAKTARENKVNLLLARFESPGAADAESLRVALGEDFTLEDAEIYAVRHDDGKNAELRSHRIFIEPAISQTIFSAEKNARGVLSYFVNELRRGERAAPYSIVAAIDDPLTSKLRDDEILITKWLAEDLQAHTGDALRLDYYVAGPLRLLLEKQASFRVAGIVENEPLPAARELMPDFPGLSDAENCRDWDPGIEIDFGAIREKDEQYWDRYRGTPKAYLNLAAGRKLWSNRYGDLTAIRFAAEPGADDFGSGMTAQAMLRQSLDPARAGLQIIPVRERMLNAGNQALDFSQLFLGFSMFLIGAALILTGLLFRFGVEQRAREIGLLAALGFSAAQIRRIFLGEGIVLALLGGGLGVLAGSLYTCAVLNGLATIWSGAVGGAALAYHGTGRSFAIGFGGCMLISIGTIYRVLRGQLKFASAQLLSGEANFGLSAGLPQSGKHPFGGWIFWGSGIAAVALLYSQAGAENYSAGAFFGAAVLLLIFFINGSLRWLRRRGTTAQARTFGLFSLTMKNNLVRPGRSLAVIALLACGCFMVLAVGANQRNAGQNARERASGTGGFAFYGETALPVFHDLNSAQGLEHYNLDPEDLHGARFVPLRVLEGDDASCLNLNRAQQPRLLAVDPQQLDERQAFNFVKINKAEFKEKPWSSLRQDLGENVIPAIGDYASMTWALGLKLGDSLEYTNESGKPFKIQLVGMIADSILQGSLIIAEDRLIQHYPSQSGYRAFLIDAPPDRLEAMASALNKGLQDYGLELVPAARRLNEFFAVQNTYLLIFLALGGLGVLLGSAGFGIVLLRNVLERRAELALLRAVGFTRGALFKILLLEHFRLLALGLIAGVFSALIAVVPALSGAARQIPFNVILLLILAILFNGMIWLTLAGQWSLRGNLLEALRNE